VGASVCLQNESTDTLISSDGKQFAAEFEFFFLSNPEKYQHFCVEALGPRPITSGEFTFLKAD